MVSMLGIIPLQTVSPMVNMMSDTLRRMLAQNQVIGGPVTVTLDHVPPPDPEPPVITSPTATPGTLGPSQSKITLGAHVTDNVGVTLVYIGVYEKGKTDATIDGAFYL